VSGNVGSRWTGFLGESGFRHSDEPLLVGVFRGEGIGSEVISAALDVLEAVSSQAGFEIEICEGGPIGREAEQLFGTPLPASVVSFCEAIFARNGAILCGPGGGRFVYSLRTALNLFLKISPVRSDHGVPDTSCLRPDLTRSVDVLLARENVGGIYQGEWLPISGEAGERSARHSFGYTESQVTRFLDAAARLAKRRRGRMTVVWKQSGIPSISGLWRECAEAVAQANGVDLELVDVDLMAYRLVSTPQRFDVIAAANLFGDILADLAAALLGSRGISFSGNFSQTRNAVYQTNHGAAYDLAGSDRANPAGQIFSLAMMLRESFGLYREAAAVEQAICQLWQKGWRTEDVANTGCRIVGTREMGSRVAERAAEILTDRERVADDRNAAAALSR
jgi:3-isopropylmalate dehydrogenase